MVWGAAHEILINKGETYGHDKSGKQTQVPVLFVKVDGIKNAIKLPTKPLSIYEGHLLEWTSNLLGCHDLEPSTPHLTRHSKTAIIAGRAYDLGMNLHEVEEKLNTGKIV